MAAGPSTAGFGYFRNDLPPLANGSTRILKGKKLANGACRYPNVDDETEVPPGGWEVRTLALDPNGCRKLIEEGTPTAAALAAVDGTESVSAVASTEAPDSGGASALAAYTTKRAYIRIFWMDPVNIKVNQDVTELKWDYNGSVVGNGVTIGHWVGFTPTGWINYGNTVSDLYATGLTSYRGQTTSHFYNTTFCKFPLPTVYTHYYYVRMWGHANGTATWSQSSDSIDECLPFHWDKLTAYGSFPGF
jgi:hypothetical protein